MGGGEALERAIDLNGDALPDLVMGNEESTAQGWVNPGDLSLYTESGAFFDFPTSVGVTDIEAVDVNRDAQVVAKAWDKPRASSAMEAWGNIQLERSVRAYEKGDRAEAQRLAQESVSTLRGAAYDFDDESLAEQAAGAAAFGDAFEAAEPATVEGRIATKKAKEWSLDNVR